MNTTRPESVGGFRFPFEGADGFFRNPPTTRVPPATASPSGHANDSYGNLQRVGGCLCFCRLRPSLSGSHPTLGPET
ncbi:MAG: hypothetical protein MI923_25845 [Phycisphaerales bacterium]|nr:hypothetical protein [Phycisphaerales bacterium]